MSSQGERLSGMTTTNGSKSLDIYCAQDFALVGLSLGSTMSANMDVSCEDAWPLKRSALMDGVRASDNANAMPKRINADEDHHPHEVEIGNSLPSLGPSPADHCSYARHAASAGRPQYLDNCDAPLARVRPPVIRYHRRGSRVYQADVNVRVRVCNSCTTIMLPIATAIPTTLCGRRTFFPAGIPPQRQDRKPDYKSTTRGRGSPLNTYYLIDFGLSRRYGPANGPPWEGIPGGDKSPPEHTRRAACDSFPTDIYFLGNLIHRHFLDATILR
ncbi:hypothetical protein DFH08DRAFT_270587 [Mycena albidolilacea]|uniref:Uncharacterized protein n=1 Tax=Mycena albidolilacea TaxID=1033008 RepID=A0AAD7APB0_9AGAR|nr:hypothetical protein DFH08DRAFT_270587 [Mycena albidolilacea]